MANFYIKLNFYFFPYRKGETPFHAAVNSGHLKLCEMILDNLTDKNPKNNKGETALHVAAYHGHTEICKMILDKSENKNPKGMYNRLSLIIHPESYGLNQPMFLNCTVRWCYHFK